MKIVETIPIYTTANVLGWSWLGLFVGIIFLASDILMIGGCIAVFRASTYQNWRYGIFDKVIVIFFTCIAFILSYWTTSTCFKNAKEVETFDHNEYIIQANEDTTLGEINEYEILEYIDDYTFRVKER